MFAGIACNFVAGFGLISECLTVGSGCILQKQNVKNVQIIFILSVVYYILMNVIICYKGGFDKKIFLLLFYVFTFLSSVI